MERIGGLIITGGGDGEALELGLTEDDGLTEAEGLKLFDADALGETEAEGEIL